MKLNEAVVQEIEGIIVNFLKRLDWIYISIVLVQSVPKVIVQRFGLIARPPFIRKESSSFGEYKILSEIGSHFFE